MRTTTIILALVIAIGRAGADVPPEVATTEIATAAGHSLPIAEFEQIVRAAMAATATPGVDVAVINHGKVIYRRLFGVENVDTAEALSEGTTFEAASLSKPLFGFLAMTFVEDGKLDLDRPLHEYLPNPDLAFDDRYRGITARQVLSHRSGLPNWRDDDPERGLALGFTPGQGFEYSGEGYEYLAAVLTRIADTDDKGLEALFQQRIATPLGMTRTRFIPTRGQLCARATPHRDGKAIRLKSADPTFGAAYSVHSDAADYIKFVAGILRGDVLDTHTYAQYLDKQEAAIPLDDPGRALGLADWALGFSVYELPIGRFFTHGGNNAGYSSLVMLNRETQWGAVIFTNADQANDMLLAMTAALSGLEFGS